MSSKKGTTKHTRDFIEAWNTNSTELQSSTRLLAATKASALPNQLNNVNTIAEVHNHPPPPVSNVYANMTSA